MYGKEYYEWQKGRGLDYLFCGEWQKDFGAYVQRTYAPHSVLDVGCACGAIANGIALTGCKVTAIDINEHMIGLGEKAFPRVRFYKGGAEDMWMFKDSAFDFVHCGQVAEHWVTANVATSLSEIARVGTRIFLTVATPETDDGSDESHLTVKPLEWWYSVAAPYWKELRSGRMTFRGCVWDYLEGSR